MKRVSLVPLLLLLCFVGAHAQGQDNTIPGAVWRVSTYKVKPGKMNDALMDLRKNFRVVNEEYKRLGVILDYKIYFNTTTDGPNDWDYAVATAYKNWAALDTLASQADAVTLKHYGTAEKRQQAADARNEFRDLVSTRLYREQTLKPLP